MARVSAILREYKEIVILLLALGGIAAVRPVHDAGAVTMEDLGRKVDALIRLQCVTAPPERLALAGIHCIAEK